MRITRVVARNILSFARFELDLDTRLTVIVGPNGAGKSNLIKLIDIGSAGMLWADDQASVQGLHELLQGFAAARFRGAPAAEETEVRITVDLTQSHERQLLSSYMQAAVYTSLANATQGWDIGFLEQYVAMHVTWEHIEPLAHGTIVMRHPGYQGGDWSYEYEFMQGPTTFTWTLGPFGAAEGIVRKGVATTSRVSAAERLATPKEGTDGKSGPPAAFSLDQLLPNEGEQLVLKVEGPQQWPGPAFFRRFAELAGISQTFPGGRSYSFARVLRLSLETAVRVVSVPAALDRGHVPRAIPGRYTWDDLYSVPPARDPGLLPLRLFRLKNGSAAERDRYKAVQALFSQLAPERHFDLSFDNTPPPAAQPSVAASARNSQQVETASSIGLTLLVVEDHGAGVELPIQLTGAGTQEALVLAEALADSDGSVVILDEPALNLQPGWQALIRSLLSTATGQFVTITHSPQLVPTSSAADLGHIVRLTRTPPHGTQAFRLDMTPDAAEIARLVKELASMEVRSLLFATGVVLVEGETELGALPIWCENGAVASSRHGPDHHHLAFFSVGGETHFRVFLSYLHSFAVPWAGLCDGHAFIPGKHNILSQIVAASAGTAELTGYVKDELTKVSVMDTDIFRGLVARAAEEGFYTVASGWTSADKSTGITGDESFEIFIEREYPGALDRAKQEVGTSKVRQGRWVAEHYPCPTALDRFYGNVLDRLGLAALPK